eukprot:gene12023-15125_t
MTSSFQLSEKASFAQMDMSHLRVCSLSVDRRDIVEIDKMTIPISLRDDDCDADPTPEPTVPVDDRRNDRFIECMNVLNDKLCKATISKDYAMINTVVASMTNVIKSTL